MERKYISKLPQGFQVNLNINGERKSKFFGFKRYNNDLNTALKCAKYWRDVILFEYQSLEKIY